jgi:5'-nucleotidase
LGRSVALALAVAGLVFTFHPSGGAWATSRDASRIERARLHVVVTNDDGVGAAGIDAIVEALRRKPGIRVSVVAPATNRSGSGGSTTPGPLTWKRTTTASGHPAVAVDGFPADTVRVALDDLHLDPDLVVSGINEGQNIGPLAAISGTVGAARAAFARGIPALAVSQGIGTPPAYANGVRRALSWIRVHRHDLERDRDDALDDSATLNIPTCTVGRVRGVVEVPTAVAANGRDLLHSDCTSRQRKFTDDVDAFNNGFATLSPLLPHLGEADRRGDLVASEGR